MYGESLSFFIGFASLTYVIMVLLETNAIAKGSLSIRSFRKYDFFYTLFAAFLATAILKAAQ